MDNGWDVPPEEDIDTLLEDEDEHIMWTLIPESVGHL